MGAEEMAQQLVESYARTLKDPNATYVTLSARGITLYQVKRNTRFPHMRGPEHFEPVVTFPFALQVGARTGQRGFAA